ncbi:1, 4-beta cellobiohydrolase [Clohesyomyces aquaticus]|uniref:Glucanase n=1 Tax=Clohesyomyces aquaticus TaxID=1231657 RepID=A0A1Y1ZN37_9PLEO|nr:1, 4-beta cellobiohydrolase [Clohesyomyces aquaticus]
MKITVAFALAADLLFSATTHAFALPPLSTTKLRKRAPGLSANANACDAPVSLNASTNIWKNYTLHPTLAWRNQINAAAAAIPDVELRKQALEVGKSGTFVWIEGKSQISKIEDVVKDLPCKNVLGLVISGIENKACLSAGTGLKQTYDYAAEYIDPIAKVIKAHPNSAFALIVEPGVAGNVLLDVKEYYGVWENENSTSCKPVIELWRQRVQYALKALNLPNVVLYLDAANGDQLGWRDTISYVAHEFTNIYVGAGSPSQFRGLATNVAAYHSWDASPGENFLNVDAAPAIDALSEKRYVYYLRKSLNAFKSPLPTYHIMDTSRNAVLGLRRDWRDWCNINGAGFGVRPGLQATSDPMLDNFVWVKWGGVSDGSSEVGAATYDSYCAKDDAVKPSPERGQWFQSYFETLVSNAKPVFRPS